MRLTEAQAAAAASYLKAFQLDLEAYRSYIDLVKEGKMPCGKFRPGAVTNIAEPKLCSVKPWYRASWGRSSPPSR